MTESSDVQCTRKNHWQVCHSKKQRATEMQGHAFARLKVQRGNSVHVLYARKEMEHCVRGRNLNSCACGINVKS